jgi:segregation and condensation protein A
VEKILEYKEYKERAVIFKELEERQSKYFWRVIDEAKLIKEFPPSNPVGSIDMDHLLTAFSKVLNKMSKRQEVVSLSREEITIQDRIAYIKSKLKHKPNGLSFYKLFSEQAGKQEVIVTFLAILELIRRGIITVRQNHLFEDIFIFLNQTEEGSQLNVNSIS